VNFFQAQDTARRKTWQLAALFAAAVLSLIVLTNLLIAAVFLLGGSYASTDYATTQPQSLLELFANMPTQYWLVISAGVVGVVTVASLYKYLTVSGGGRTIAEALGGQLIHQSSGDQKQRRALNVVEEMAIAAGVPVPPVYLIDEPSINAFAAGFSIDDAVIGLNQGTLDHLTRDELQGVVGHEFSHILNGDCRTNLRLIAMLHGILFIGIIGYGVLRGMGGMGGRSHRRNSDGGLPILALGVGLLVIGYSGTFFGNLIKAAVSRQREYLADAAAVQFTRNPSGIADSLKKIGALPDGSAMSGSSAQEISHMFFGQSAHLFMNGLMSTHPPLDTRIRAIEPNWDGRFPTLAVADRGHSQERQSGDSTDVVSGLMDRVSQLSQASAGPSYANQSDGDSISVTVAAPDISDEVGQLNQVSLDNAIEFIVTTDPVLRDAAHDPWASRGLIYAMLLDGNETLQGEQMAYLQSHAEPGVPEHVARLQSATQNLSEPRKLTLVEMAMPALKELSTPQYKRFMENTVAMIKSDRNIDLFEWVLHRLLMKELRAHFDGPQRVSARYRSVARIPAAAQTLLSALARSGHDNKDGQRAAFAAGLKELELTGELDTEADPNFARLNDALKSLQRLKPLAKPKVIKACAAVAMADGHVSGHEGALLQGVAAALDCPLPPSIYQHDHV
jgi:Zn-dependent protease with chaperone function